MDTGIVDLIPHGLAAIAGGAGVYAAIKSDLKEALITAKTAEKSADKAHDRLDTHITDAHMK
jgi:hypothetical protein